MQESRELPQGTCVAETIFISCDPRLPSKRGEAEAAYSANKWTSKWPYTHELQGSLTYSKIQVSESSF